MNPTPPPAGPCRGKTDLFFPTSISTPVEKARLRAALALCDACDHKAQCLEYALHYEPYGIWGGTTARARERMRRDRKIRLRHHDTLTVREIHVRTGA